jgi:hypothetical protein
LYRSGKGKTMTKKILATAALFLSFAAISASAETWKGTVSDSMCAAKHQGSTDIACAQKCVKGGSPAVFVVDGKVYKIENQEAVKDHIGHKVSVSGTMTGDTIHIDEVKM